MTGPASPFAGGPDDAHAWRALCEGAPDAAVRRACTRLDVVEPALGALASWDTGWALERAARVAREPALHLSDALVDWRGVPIVLKDAVSYPHLPWRMGSRAFADRLGAQGSPFTDALDVAGLVVLGKSAMPEFGLLPYGRGAAGTTQNPVCPERVVFGSSSGSAAAVAAGIVPLAHGTDGGGSVRLPASSVGLWGYKPTSRHALPSTVELGLMSDLVCDGVIARSVRDVTAFMQLVQNPLSPWGAVHAQAARALRIGVYAGLIAPEPAVAAALGVMTARCAALGHTLVPLLPPPVDHAALGTVYFALSGHMSDELALMAEAERGRPLRADAFEAYTRSVQRWFHAQTAASSREEVLEHAAETCDAVATDMARWMAGVDVVLCPTAPMRPPRVADCTLPRTFSLDAQAPHLAATANTAVWNVTGGPSLSVPGLEDADGVPIGMLLSAAQGEDSVILGLAAALEANGLAEAT